MADKDKLSYKDQLVKDKKNFQELKRQYRFTINQYKQKMSRLTSHIRRVKTQVRMTCAQMKQVQKGFSTDKKIFVAKMKALKHHLKSQKKSAAEEEFYMVTL